MSEEENNEPTPQEIAATFNATNVVVEVEDGPESEYEFRYFQGRDEVEQTNNTDGRITLGGNKEPRSYVYTWMTPFGEESIPSDPTDTVYLRTGEDVVVSDLPTQPPASDQDFLPTIIRGIRLYRSIANPGGAEYFLLATMWFPNAAIRYERSNNEAVIETVHPHGLIPKDRVLIEQGVLSSTEPYTVISTVDRYRFKVDSPGPDGSGEDLAAPEAMYYDVAESLDDDPRWWGKDGDYSFLDDFDQGSLSRVLPSLNYEPPPLGIKGFVLLPNNILAGFVGSRLYLSEPNEYHAFPSENIINFDYDIVALAVSSGTLVVLTEGYPYRVDGNSPDSMTPNKVDSMYPCLSAESVVVTGAGVTYATHSGLATYNAGRGASRATQIVFDRRAWQEFFDDFDPSKIKGFEYEDKYVGTIPTNFIGPNPGNFREQRCFVFEPDQQTGGHVTLITMGADPLDADDNYAISYNVNSVLRANMVDCGWTDPTSGDLYFAVRESYSRPTRWVQKFDAGDPLGMYWRSKDMKLATYTNIGAVRASFLSEDSQPVEFVLYSNDEVIGETISLENKVIHRLPAGYKSDSYEFSVKTDNETGIDLRSVHLGETPFSLRGV